MTVVLRFAPSPTGHMHIGNARTALVNWLFARHHGGRFLLRFDDTDPVRSKPEYASSIEHDLAWLGWDHDGLFSQSSRLERYMEVTQQLIASGRLYPCYETPEELEFRRKRQLALGRPPIYDRAALKLDEAARYKLEEQGRKPHWRFLLLEGESAWPDMAHGDITMEATHLSDPVLIREDGSPVYTLCSVIDDMDYGITHIIRGNDHITNTAVQIQLWQAIGKNPREIMFAHLPLITGEKGEGLSKRLGSLGIKELREKGMEPLAIGSYLARLGTSDEIAPALSLSELIESFSIGKFSHGSPKFVLPDLDRLNARLIHQLSHGEVLEKLKARDLPAISAEFWDAVRGNLSTLDELREIYRICYGDITPVVEERDYIDIALETLPVEPWNEGTWKTWTEILKEKTGRKGKELFMPLRKVLTGMDHGPEMQKILLLLGREKALLRLQTK